MDEEHESEKSEFKTKRFKELGFYPQKEIPANRLLPVMGLLLMQFLLYLLLCHWNFSLPKLEPKQYADQLDNESSAMLADIKNNLAKTVALRDFKPGVTLVLQKLSQWVLSL